MAFMAHGNSSEQPAAPEAIVLRPASRRKLLIAPALVAVIMLACVPALVGQGGPRPPDDHGLPISAKAPFAHQAQTDPPLAESPKLPAQLDKTIRAIFASDKTPAVNPPAPVPVTPTPQPASGDAEPSNPNIVLEAPPSAQVSTIIVISAARTTNFKKLRWIIKPPVPYYPDPRLHPNPREIVFAAKDEGTYTVTLRATSPDGGDDERTEQIQVGDPDNAPTASMTTRPRGVTNYTNWVRENARLITGSNRKGDLLAMSGCFNAAWGLIQSGGIRTREELYANTDRQTVRALGTDYENCTAFLTAFLHESASENGGMERLEEVWQQTASGMLAASK